MAVVALKGKKERLAKAKQVRVMKHLLILVLLIVADVSCPQDCPVHKH